MQILQPPRLQDRLRRRGGVGWATSQKVPKVLVPVSAEVSRAKGGVWVALADVALHHRVHMVPPFEHWMARGRDQQPTVFKLNTHAWL